MAVSGTRDQVMVLLREGLKAKVVERAEAGEMSMNEWLNRAVEFALLKGGTELTHTTTKKVTL